MALFCDNWIDRHPYNFDTGFCDDCQKEHNKEVFNQLKDN